MPTLTSLINVFSEHPPLAGLSPHRCLRKRLNTNKCELCLDVCDSGALSLKGREIVLDEGQCSGCMLCVAACPQDALTTELELDELLGALKKGSHPRVLCVKRRNLRPNDILVPCLGIFSKPLLATLGSSECGSITFEMEGCSACHNSKAAEIFVCNHKEVTAALTDLLKSDLVIAEMGKEIARPEVERRSYLLNVQTIINNVSKKIIAVDPKVVPEEQRNRSVPLKTNLIRKLIQNIEPDSRTQCISFFSHNLLVNNNCTLCPLCKGICPTGAITMKRSEHGKELYFSYLDCSGCGLCVEFCKKDALTLTKLLAAPATDQAIRLV